MKIVEFVKNILGINKYCNSCAMSLKKDSSYGTEKDGSENHDYCSYCFQNGQFTYEYTMEEMVEICVPHIKMRVRI